MANLNLDRADKTSGLLPGAGAIVAPLATALGKSPVAIGKPNKTMLDCIRAKYVPLRLPTGLVAEAQ